jgi:hypothetical protein
MMMVMVVVVMMMMMMMMTGERLILEEKPVPVSLIPPRVSHEAALCRNIVVDTTILPLM